MLVAEKTDGSLTHSEYEIRAFATLFLEKAFAHNEYNWEENLTQVTAGADFLLPCRLRNKSVLIRRETKFRARGVFLLVVVFLFFFGHWVCKRKEVAYKSSYSIK